MKKYTGSNPMEGKYFDFKKRQWVEERLFPWGDPEYIAFYGIPEIDINAPNIKPIKSKRKLKPKWS